MSHVVETTPVVDFRSRLAALLPPAPMVKPVRAYSLAGEKFMRTVPYQEAEFPLQMVERRQ